jgi:UDP-3-O-[3-hydroxymyristoyl] N-acetylglucosamine deacetylase
MQLQHTLARPVAVSGVGLHSAVNVNLRILPAPTNRGIVFRRTDLDNFEIEAGWRHVARVSYATSLMKRGVLISTTEHLLSALVSTGVDNAIVEIDALELPILDGSALPYIRMIEEAGLKRQRARRTLARILKAEEVVENGKRIGVYPPLPGQEGLAVECTIDFPHPLIGRQSYAIDLTPESYAREIAPARTFGFLRDEQALRHQGLIRGASVENALALTEDGLLNEGGLRFPDEFARHKLLDLIGDLALFGRPIWGRVVAERAGHYMHVALVSHLMRDRSLWVETSGEREPEIAAAAVIA